jgi:hypothetical protein
VGYWGDEWHIGVKPCAKTSLSKQIVQKASVEGKLSLKR